MVQKLIETLKSRQQTSLVISALEPGFLALIKDLNGNHVVQRCLQCLSYEDSKVLLYFTEASWTFLSDLPLFYAISVIDLSYSIKVYVLDFLIV